MKLRQEGSPQMRVCPLGASPSWGQAQGLMILEVVGDLDANTWRSSHNLWQLTESILLANDAQPYLHIRLTHCSTQSGDWLLAEYQQSSEQGRLSQPCRLLAWAGWPPQYVHYEIISSSFNHAMEIPLSRSSKPIETFSNYLEPFTQFSSHSVHAWIGVSWWKKVHYEITKVTKLFCTLTGSCHQKMTKLIYQCFQRLSNYDGFEVFILSNI